MIGRKLVRVLSGGKLVGVLLATLAVAGLSAVVALSYSSTSVESTTIEVPGTSDQTNNLTFVPENKYAIVASFAPTNDREGDDFDFRSLDNRFVYLVDTGDPSQLLRADVGCHYPTKVVLDTSSNTVFVRGTDVVETSDGEAPVEVVAHVHLNNTGGFDETVVKVPIKGVSEKWSVQAEYGSTLGSWATTAPSDFVIGREGKYLVFTNGASIFTYSVQNGYIYNVDLVTPADFDPDNYTIASLEISSESDTVIAIVKRKRADGLGHYSELHFYELVEEGDHAGSVNLRKQVLGGDFPGATSLTDGSNVVLNADARNALFMISDGSLCQVVLDGKVDEAQVKRVAVFPELAVAQGVNPGARLISYDFRSNTVGIVERGYYAQIRRPIFGRPGRIRRPIFEYIRVGEPPAVAIVRLGKKNKVLDQKVITGFGVTDVAISNLLFQDSRGLIGDSKGHLFSVDLGSGAIEVLVETGRSLDYIAFNSLTSSVLGISSFGFDDGGNVTPGGLILARFRNQGSIAAMLTSPRLISKSLVPTIRRPCNIGR